MTTSLPFTFESAIQSTLDRLQGLVQRDDPLSVYVKKRFVECMESFADNIHHLAFVDTNISIRMAPLDFDEDSGNPDQDGFNSGKFDLPTMSEDSRLLIILNNCTHTKKFILPALQSKFRDHYGVDLYSPSQRGIIQLLELLENMILRKYVCHKTISLNTIVRSGVLFSGLDWATIKSPPTGIRDYVMSIMLELVFIHDELHRVSRDLLRPVLTTVLENIYQAFIDCLQYIDTISNHGVLQIGMELEFISSIMRKYKSPIATGLSNELDHILQYNAIMEPKSEEVLAKDKKIVKGHISSKLQEASLLVECFTGRDANDLKA
jgi:hypothetical protein